MARAQAADTLAFWDAPQRGANCFNEAPPDAAYFQALRAYGATWVRLTWSKWPSASKGRDFLSGNLDDYRSLVREDLETLRGVLDSAHAAGLRVVLVPLELPGARWVQLNDGNFDDRLWSDRSYWQQAAAFWRDLAGALRNHPAIAAYNLINEPVPERRGGLEEHAAPETMRDWYQTGARHDARSAGVLPVARRVRSGPSMRTHPSCWTPVSMLPRMPGVTGRRRWPTRACCTRITCTSRGPPPAHPT